MVAARSLQVLHALAALRIPDALQTSPKTAKELAPMVGEDLPGLYLHLSACTALCCITSAHLLQSHSMHLTLHLMGGL